MNIGNLFWDLPGSPSGFLRQLEEALPRGISLRLEDALPFPQVFWQRVSRDLDIPLKVLDWGSRTCSPGDFLLKQLFTPRQRACYFPADPYGSYIASLQAEPVILRIRGIRGSAAAREWSRLIADYRQAGGRDLLFAVECDQAACGADLSFRVDAGLHRYFAIMMAGILGNTPVTAYQAELAANLAPRDPELCSELLLRGEQLLLDPAAVAGEYGLDDLQTASALRQANLVCLYPKIEQLRFDFVRSHREAIGRCLPLRSMEGELIENPMDLEVGPLSYLLRNRDTLRGLSGADQIHLCAAVRNKIAHDRPVPYDTLLALDRI